MSKIENTKQIMKSIYNNSRKNESTEELENQKKRFSEMIRDIFNLDKYRFYSAERVASFNALIVETAQDDFEKIAKIIVSHFVEDKTYPLGELVEIQIDDKKTVDFVLSVDGSGVDYVKLNGKSRYIVPSNTYKLGISYSPTDMTREPIEEFNNTVDKVVEASVRLVLNKIMSLINANKANIPNRNKEQGANLTLPEIKKVLRTIVRGNVSESKVLLADRAFIDYLGEVAVGSDVIKVIPDEQKKELWSGATIGNFYDTAVVSLPNDFKNKKDVTSTTLQYKANEAFILGVGRNKPIHLARFGQMTSSTKDIDTETNIVEFDAILKLGAVFLYPEYVGLIDETTITY